MWFMELLTGLPYYTVSISSTRYQIEQYRRNGTLKKIEQVYEKYCEWYIGRQSVDGTGLPYNGRQAWQALVHMNRDGANLVS